RKKGCFRQPRVTPIRQLTVNLSGGVQLAIGHPSCTDRKVARIESPLGGSVYESCSCSRGEQFVADQRRSATSTRPQSSVGEDACKRHLLYRRTPHAWTFSRSISPNLRSRASRGDRCRGC